MLTNEERYEAITRLENGEDVAAFDIIAMAMVEELFKDGRILLSLNYDNKKVVAQNMADIQIPDPGVAVGLILDAFRPHYWKARAKARKEAATEGKI